MGHSSTRWNLSRNTRCKMWMLFVASACALLLLLRHILRWINARPSHDRAWRPDQAVLPQVAVENGMVHVHNLRDFHYRPPGNPSPRYRVGTFYLHRLERVWYVVVPFRGRWRGLAHTFVTFGFSDGQYVSISIEARKTVGTRYSLYKGALRRYELMFVIADERDLMGARAVAGGNRVHLYPLRLTTDQARTLFLDLAASAYALEQQPAFYNSITDNCTSRMLQAIHRAVPGALRAGVGWILPGFSEGLLHDCGLMDTDLPLDEARQRFDVTERVQSSISRRDFSARIRL